MGVSGKYIKIHKKCKNNTNHTFSQNANKFQKKCKKIHPAYAVKLQLQLKDKKHVK